MTDPNPPPCTHVLSRDAVRWAIEALHQSTCHSSFLLYLFMREAMVEGGSSTNIPVDLGQIRPLLWLPGGPPNKPMFRPLSERNVKSLSKFWIRDHLAGSYAPSSLRQGSSWLLSQDGTEYELPADHVERARTSFLADKPISVLAMGAFLLRDFGFDLTCDDGHPVDLIAAFRDMLAFRPEHDAQFKQLFHEDVPKTPTRWFDTFIEDAVNG